MIDSYLDKYIDAWNTRDTEKLLSYCSKDIVYEDVALKKVMDLKGLEIFIRGSLKNFAALRFEKVSACIADNAVAWEWRMIGTRTNGEKVDVPGMSMTTFKNEKVISNRDYWSSVPTPN